MRESFGGAFMIKLVLVFIVIYITFMAIAVEYAKVFRVKNQIINILEQSQFKLGDEISPIDNYLARVPYNKNGVVSVQDKCNGTNFGGTRDNFVLTERGACIEGKSDSNGNTYFKVTTYISVELPFFNISMVIPVSGETKTIRY